MKELFHRLIQPAGNKAGRSAVSSPSSAQTIHFLHISKNAGTQIARISEQVNRLSSERKIQKRPHRVTLKNIPADDPYFFSIRNPISRFSSGFYSRKRKGQPRTYEEWSAHEEMAFSEFEHANDLAESLFEADTYGSKAWAAMESIKHTSRNQSDWFAYCGNFLTIRPPVWIVRQENFEADLKRMISRAFPEVDITNIDFGVDKIASHKNDYSRVPPLSKKARENLTRWYARDFAFFDMCGRWIDGTEAS